MMLAYLLFPVTRVWLEIVMKWKTKKYYDKDKCIIFNLRELKKINH